MTPWHFFEYGLALAGSLLIIGLVLVGLWFVVLFVLGYQAQEPESTQQPGQPPITDGRIIVGSEPGPRRRRAA